MLFLNIIYVLLAVAMIVLILMQRGAGAAAGSGFGGGASGTVFGARGSSSFLSKATKWMAIAFFILSMFMAWQATRDLRGAAGPNLDLGVMSQVPTVPSQPAAGGEVPAMPSAAPATDSEVPQTPAVVAPAAGPAPGETPESQQAAPTDAPASGD
ncbi:MAG: preprotein translocase subunit SecG [Pseudomonadota bacterium]|nr:preprotein translocase subunit SecG [Pseudomonadota bacterium]